MYNGTLIYPFQNEDDNLFDSVEEIDLVPYVGNSAINKIKEYCIKK